MSYTPLIEAIENTNLKLVKELVNAGADVNETKTGSRYTPLHAAVSWHNFEIVKFLVEHGADINKKDGHGRSPIMLAIKERKSAANEDDDFHENYDEINQIMGYLLKIKEYPSAAKRIQKRFKQSKNYAEWAYHPERLKAQGYFNAPKESGIFEFGKRRIKFVISDIKYLSKLNKFA